MLSYHHDNELVTWKGSYVICFMNRARQRWCSVNIVWKNAVIASQSKGTQGDEGARKEEFAESAHLNHRLPQRRFGRLASLPSLLRSVRFTWKASPALSAAKPGLPCTDVDSFKCHWVRNMWETMSPLSTGSRPELINEEVSWGVRLSYTLSCTWWSARANSASETAAIHASNGKYNNNTGLSWSNDCPYGI